MTQFNLYSRLRFALTLSLTLVCCLAGAVMHTFSYRSAQPLKSVNLAGQFNNWNKDATPMKSEDGGQSWSVSLDLDPGRYQYKFVLNGDTWVTDPAAKAESDGNGNTNSIVLIAPDDYATPAAKGDGIITKSALRHSPEEPDLNYDRGQLQFALRARPDDIAHVFLHVEGRTDAEMEVVGQDEFYARYRRAAAWDRKKDLRYDFRLTDGATTRFFGPNGLTDQPDGNYFSVSAATYRPFEVPNWVEHSVIYQIFPDRFANGDPTNDPPGTKPWDATSLDYATWLGGDLAGIEQHEGYLKNLGISCIYFNPMFQSPVYHRYETTDYHLIAKELGTNLQFDNLTRKLKADGIRTVLDGVFNHTATNFFAFDDVVKRGKASPYVDWYTFHGFPVQLGKNHNYVAWFDYPSLPKLHHANQGVQDYIFGVPKFWDKQADIAGWRLDAANEVPDFFWQGFRKTVKAINPNDWIVGEEWGDASHWLKGDMWDSVMNYPFLFATLGFVGQDGDGQPSTYAQKLLANYSTYAPQVSRNLMNLVDSHDTPRVLTACGGDRQLANLAVILEFSWVGVPTVYYGDEIGMAGGKDPDNRRGMQWQDANAENPTLLLYKRLIAARNASPELQSGDPKILLQDDKAGLLGFARTYKGKAAICLVNRSSTTQVATVSLSSLPHAAGMYWDVVGMQSVAVGPDGNLSVSLKPKSAALLVSENRK